MINISQTAFCARYQLNVVVYMEIFVVLKFHVIEIVMLFCS